MRNRSTRRRGASTLDYFLVMGIIAPLAALFVLPSSPGYRLLQGVYELMCGLIAWPFP